MFTIGQRAIVRATVEQFHDISVSKEAQRQLEKHNHIIVIEDVRVAVRTWVRGRIIDTKISLNFLATMVHPLNCKQRRWQ